MALLACHDCTIAKASAILLKTGYLHTQLASLERAPVVG
jgi:hypothetical protein